MKTQTKLPTYEQYKDIVDDMVASETLSIEQSIILLTIFKAGLKGTCVHINYLMQLTNMRWKEINWTLNGLVVQGAIKKLDKKYYSI